MESIGWRPSHIEGFKFATAIDPARDQIIVRVKTVPPSEDIETEYAIDTIPYEGYSANLLGDTIERLIGMLKKRNPQ